MLPRKCGIDKFSHNLPCRITTCELTRVPVLGRAACPSTRPGSDTAAGSTAGSSTAGDALRGGDRRAVVERGGLEALAGSVHAVAELVRQLLGIERDEDKRAHPCGRARRVRGRHRTDRPAARAPYRCRAWPAHQVPPGRRWPRCAPSTTRSRSRRAARPACLLSRTGQGRPASAASPGPSSGSGPEPARSGSASL